MNLRKETTLIFILLLLSSASTFGQKESIILTREQNNAWLDSLALLSKKDQIELIKKRLLSDTLIYYLSPKMPDVIVLEDIKKSDQRKCYNLLSEGRIVYHIYYDNKKYRGFNTPSFICHNWTDSKEVIKFHNFLTIDKIQNIEILDSEKVKAVYRSSKDNFGIITFILKKRRYIKEFIGLNLNKS